MSRFLLAALLAALLAGAIPAQELQSEVEDPAARAAFDRMAKALWRPRDHGLEELRFEFEVEIVHPDRPIEKHGPFPIRWRSDGGWRLLDEKGEVDPAPEKRMSVGFADRVVNDLVGWDSAEMTRGRKLRLREARLLEIEIPGPPNPDEVRVEKILLELGDEGALARQTLVGTGGAILARLDYSYLDRGGRRLVAKVRRESSGTRVLKTETYQDVGAFSFPAEIRSLSAEHRLEIVRYRAIEVLKPAPSKH